MSTPTTHATPTPSAILTKSRDGRPTRTGFRTRRQLFARGRDHVGLSTPDDC